MELHQPSLGRRLAAFMFDLILSFTVYTVAYANVSILLDHLLMPGVDLTRHGNVFVLLYGLTAMVYSVLLISSRRQATPGRRMFRVYVTRSDGGRVTSAQAALRFCLYAGPLFIAYGAIILFSHFHPSPMLIIGKPITISDIVVTTINLSMLGYYLQMFYAFCFVGFGRKKQIFVDDISHTKVVSGRL